MSLQRPKAIFFDWDGTLVDSIPFLLSAHNHVFQSFGKPKWTQAEAKQKMRLSSREMYPKIFGDDADAAITMLYDHVEKHHVSNITLLKDADSFIAFLHGHKIPMGLVSNRRDMILKKEVDALSWNHFFPTVVGAGVTPKDKPAADPLLHAIALSGLAGHERDIWFVGDTETDIRCAHAAGCRAVFIAHGMDNAEDVENLKPDLVFQGFESFQNHIKALL